jgi:hypothetical protein
MMTTSTAPGVLLFAEMFVMPAFTRSTIRLFYFCALSACARALLQPPKT